ncbi:MAG: hypothetical protein R2865_04670 [Deinococcales bacterium]
MGIDAGLKHIVVILQKEKLDSPKYSRKAEARLRRRVQQKLARREQAKQGRKLV